MPFSDHFSPLADRYAAFRPPQPAEVLEYAASLAQFHDLVWDCGTGSGQAAAGLAKFFERVIATDASASQIANAHAGPRITYRVAPAEASGLPDHVVDLVTVAQALHWFDVERFYDEVRRVTISGGAITVWGYGDAGTDDPVVDREIRHFTRVTVGPYWPPERKILDEGYRTIPFPFREVETPAFNLSAHWTLPQLLGYLRTWSASAAYARATGRDAVADAAPRLSGVWGDPATPRVIRWPISMRAGFVD
jgi:SAM-dependent methyltransferase